jgi:hypothetical protein
MRLGDRVRTTVALPSIPFGAAGVVEEVGRPFIAVRFDDGRIGFYARRQLQRLRPGCDASASTNRDIHLGFTSMAVSAGSHLFLAAGTECEAQAVASDYLIAGIQAGETCFCCVERCWRKALDSALAAKGSPTGSGSSAVIFTDPTEVYLDAPEFTADGQLARMAEALDRFGGTRLRLFGRLGREALRVIPEREWWDYEMRVTQLLREHGTTAMCAYPTSDSSYARHAQAIHPYVFSKGQLIAHSVLP